MPNTNANKGAKTPKRMTDKQAGNFWERNLAFIADKEEKRKKAEQHFT